MTNLNVYPETNVETWLPVKHYEKFYQISSLGRVKRINKKTPHRILKPFLNGAGYLVVSLSKSDQKKTHRVHKLVANHFIKKPQYEEIYEWQVNHKNGVKTDNRVVNLEWCTPSENIIHAYSLGLIKRVKTVSKQSQFFPSQEKVSNSSLIINPNETWQTLKGSSSLPLDTNPTE